MTAERQNDATVILDEGPEIQIGSRKFTLRRLDTRQVFAFTRILAGAMKYLPRNFDTIVEKDPDEAARLGFEMIRAFFTEDLAVWCAGLLGITVQEFYRLDPEATEIILDALQQHQDLERFFGICFRLWLKMAATWGNRRV